MKIEYAQLIFDEYQEGQKLDPKDRNFVLQGALDFLDKGEFSAGLALLRALHFRDPNDATVIWKMGMALSDTGEIKEALKHLNRGAELLPNESDLQVALGVALLRDGQFAEAEAALEKAVALNPNSPHALANLGSCLRRKPGCLQRAEQLCRSSIGISSKNLVAWTALAQACEAQGNLPEAQKAYRRSLELSPEGQVADFCRARLKQME
jgi:Flp pilus assembly protein TadD